MMTETAAHRVPGILALLLTYGPLVSTVLFSLCSRAGWGRRIAVLIGSSLGLTLLVYVLLVTATGSERVGQTTNQQAYAFGAMLGGLVYRTFIGLMVGAAGLAIWWAIDRLKTAMSKRQMPGEPRNISVKSLSVAELGNTESRSDAPVQEQIGGGSARTASVPTDWRPSVRYCTNCGQTLAPVARFCHACGTDLRDMTIAENPTEGKLSEPVLTPRWKVILSVLGILLVLGLLGKGSNRPDRQTAQVAQSGTSTYATRTVVAANTAPVDVTATARSTTQPRPTRVPTSTPAPTRTPRLGTAANPAPFSRELVGGNARVKLVTGRFANEFGYSEPKGGYKYLVLNVRIEGVGPSDHQYGASNFSGQDSVTGAGYDSAFVFGGDTLGSDTLSRGEYVTGTVVLEVQETAQRVIVKYDPIMFDPDDLYWVFGPELPEN